MGLSNRIYNNDDYGLVGLPLPEVPVGLLVPLRFEPRLLLLLVPFVVGDVLFGVVDCVVVVVPDLVVDDFLASVFVRGCVVVLRWLVVVRSWVVVVVERGWAVVLLTLPSVLKSGLTGVSGVRTIVPRVVSVCAEARPKANSAASVKNDFFITYNI